MSGMQLLVEQRGQVRWLTLNRPSRRNALDDRVIDALSSQAADVARDADTAVVVLAGAGESFCAGGDFHHFLSDGESPTPFLRELTDCFSRIETSPKPWIAAVHGHAIAGGLELALVCDVVVAAEGTLIGDGHLNNRLLPGGGSSVRLERAVGKSVARWLHLSGDLLTAEQLWETTWLHEIVAPSQLRPRAQELAEKLAARGGTAQQNFKRLLTTESIDLQDGLTRELDAFAGNWFESEVGSALRAFLDRRAVAPTEA